MICKACKESADRGLKGEEAHKAAGCLGGTHCDCMHRDGSPEQHIQPEALARIRAAGTSLTP
jgi:hypothetical protein